MTVRYTSQAASQLDDILNYLQTHSLRGADNVAAQLEATPSLLVQFPLSGTKTRRPGQRRIQVGGYPYVIYYRLRADEILVQVIRHTSRRPI